MNPLTEPADSQHSTRRSGGHGNATRPRLKAAIVGAGYIAPYHLEVLRHLGRVDVVGACDPDRSRLDEFCKQWQIPIAATSLGDLLERCRPDVVHVLVPPPFHFDVGRSALEAGLHVLLEKPMAVSSDECAALIELARARQLRVGVNHNAVFHPAFQRLITDASARKLGRLQHVVSTNNLPLAQLDSGEHTHWMFREPANILLEQAIHPLSQICHLLGNVREAAVIRSGERTLGTGTTFYSAWQMALTCERGTAQLFLAFGGSFPTSVVQVVGQDATARLDLLNNTYVLDRATKYLKPVDQALRSVAEGGRVAMAGGVGILNYALSTLGVRKRTDPYYASMLKSIEAFYDSFDNDTARLDNSARVGQEAVVAAEKAVDAVKHMSALGSQTRPVSRQRSPAARDGELLVLGGTGFIGRRLVAALAAAGHPVRILSRRGVPPSVGRADYEPQMWYGDIRSADEIARAADGCRSVIHLVSGAPADWAGYERLFVEGTRNVAEACIAAGVEQLLFASSIAAYDLGRADLTITENTPIDDNPKRAEYTRAKVACERLLTQMHVERGLPVTIFRPGVVVGSGGVVEHLGVGFWPTPTHCVSWGSHTNSPLPFVLVDDVVSALVAAVGRGGLAGQSFNLVGDVRLSAEEYLDALREASGRDIRLHRQAIAKWYGVEVAKWLVKAAARKPENVFPDYRDIASRSLRSPFDCSHAKQVLHWTPVSDRARFIELGIWHALEGAAG